MVSPPTRYREKLTRIYGLLKLALKQGQAAECKIVRVFACDNTSKFIFDKIGIRLRFPTVVGMSNKFQKPAP